MGLNQSIDIPNRSEEHVEKIQKNGQNFIIGVLVIVVLFGAMFLSLAAGVFSKDFTAFNNVSNLLVGGFISILGGIVGALFTVNNLIKDGKKLGKDGKPVTDKDYF